MPTIFAYDYIYLGDMAYVGSLMEIDEEQAKSSNYLFVRHSDSNLDPQYSVMFDLSKFDPNETEIAYLVGDFGYSPAVINKSDITSSENKTYELIRHLHPLLDPGIPIAMRTEDFDPKVLASRKQSVILNNITTRKTLLVKKEISHHLVSKKMENIRSITERAKQLTKRMMVMTNFLNLAEYKEFEQFLAKNPEDQQNVDEIDADILEINYSAKSSDYPNSLQNMVSTKGGSMINHFILEPAMLVYLEEKISYLEDLNSRFTTFKYQQSLKKRKQDSLGESGTNPPLKRPRKK